MWGNSLNLNPETDSGLPWAPFQEKFYTLQCRRRIAAHFAMQMKSKRSQIDNSMGTRPILYLQMGFEMCDGVRFQPNSCGMRPDWVENCYQRLKITYILNAFPYMKGKVSSDNIFFIQAVLNMCASFFHEFLMW